MNFIKSLIPGGKRRMISGNMSLDLSHITPRMLAMSYPSNNFIESLYHNNIEDISNYLNTNYDKKYLIFNLSGIPYESAKFDNRVVDFKWPDHKAPPLFDIFIIIRKAFSHLLQNPGNVICLHCLAGKGRTGTVCCCILMFAGLCRSSKDANDYYSLKRFQKLNKAVQEPSQVRYLTYFDSMLNRQFFKGLKLKVFVLEQIDITGIKLSNGESITYKIETNYYKENEVDSYTLPNCGPVVTGDVTINIYRNNTLKAWIFFNTFFIEEGLNMKYFYIKEIDPRFLAEESDYNCMVVSMKYSPYNPQNFNTNPYQAYGYSNNNINSNDFINKINNMITLENSKINNMNELLSYVNFRDKQEAYNENKRLFFGDNADDIYDTIKNEEMKNRK